MKKLFFNKNHNKWFLSAIRNIIDSYNLISPNEQLGFALSGGIDSVTLLYILAYLKKFSHLNFNLTAIHIKTGEYSTEILKIFCKNLNVDYLEKSIILPENKKNICYFCAKQKRMIIKEELSKLNIKKVVFAHNKNDVLETFLMNLTLHKRIETIQAKSCSQDFCVIRPMLDLDKKTILALHKYFDLPYLAYSCKYQKDNIRQKYRNWIEQANDEIVKKMLKNITQAFMESTKIGNSL